MKKFISVIVAALILNTACASKLSPAETDSCGSLKQWKIPHVKGNCPQITTPVMIDGTLYCVVKCSYLEKEQERKEKNRRRDDKKNKMH